MSTTAHITITSGPDRGKVFPLNDELVNIGHGSENEVMLSDATLEDYQASITSRNGRYAIYTPLDRTVEVDGSLIPADRWVWLPPRARIRVSDRTALEFIAGSGESPAGPVATAARRSETDSTATPAPARRRRAVSKQTSGKRPEREKKRRDVARFITDHAGDTLVKLGEDGHLPELMLIDSPGRKPARKREKASNPWLLYAVLAASVASSLALLLLDVQPFGSTAAQKAQARKDLVEFYAVADQEPEPYQRHLREARLAYSRGDRAGHRRALRQVLGLLNSEDLSPLTGLTGSPERDERLRELLAILLSD